MRAGMLGAFAVGFAAGMLTLALLLWHSGEWKAQASGVAEPAVRQLPVRQQPVEKPPTAATMGETGPLPHLAMPVAGIDPNKLADTFDEGRAGHKHEALDIPAARGERVTAVADGTVAKLFTSKDGGLTVYQFDTTGQFCYYYAHLDGYAPALKEGMSLHTGDVLGYVGTTGNAPPNAPHLHFAVFSLGPERKWWQGTAIDPLPLLK